MTKINKVARTATLSLADSIVWAGRETPDGRDLDEVRTRVRREVQAIADSIGQSIEVYSCKRHGACKLDVIEAN